MNRERARELLPIYQAFCDGETIQAAGRSTQHWEDTDFPMWHDNMLYRIKPEPHDIKWAAERLRNRGQVRRRDWGNKTCYCTVHHYGIVFFSDGVCREELRLYPHDLLADDWEIYEPKGNQ